MCEVQKIIIFIFCVFKVLQCRRIIFDSKTRHNHLNTQGKQIQAKITYYRPICLLNTEYKIAPASIANRIKTVIDKLISRDQLGFISGRYIGDNTRIIYDLMQFVDEKNIPGLLLLKDFEKAYDSLSRSFLKNVLKHLTLVHR